MCAKKATPANKPAATGSRKPTSGNKNGVAPATKPVSKQAAATKSATAVAPSPERKLSNDDIGLVAGEVWGLLVAKNGQSLASIKKAITAPNDVIIASIGWLAREDKLEFNASGRTLKVSLRA